VERAQYYELPMSLQPSTTPLGTFPPEDAVPQPTAPGTPGSVTTQIQVLGRFAVIGTTRNAFFVDRTRRTGVRYVYRVVAATRSGSTSAPSNLQVVPDPRPPATLGQLERAAHGSSAAAAIAEVHGHLGRLLARLAHVARTAGDDQVRELAYRLERRLRYANVAARPVRSR
jgi:hypothetical protein